MKKINLLLFTCLFLITISACRTRGQDEIKKIDITSNTISQIEPIVNEVVINEMSQAYGFNKGQDQILELIKKKYPSLESQIQIAKLKFDKSFGISISIIDSILASKGDEWIKVKNQLNDQIKASVKINDYSFDQVSEFVSSVVKRANGEIPAPIIGTLLTFNPRYLKDPTLEFTDGFKFRFNSKGNEKAKGLEFHLDLPQSWLAKDANRPNIVQKFISQNGHGSAMIMILVLSSPEFSNLSDKDVKELAQTENMKDMLPQNAQFINGGFIKIDNLPGVFQEFKLQQTQIENELLMHTINFNLYYKDKMISVQCSIVSTKNEEKNTDSIFMKYKELFKLVAGSLFINSQWKN